MGDVVKFLEGAGGAAVGFGDKMNNAFGLTKAADPGKDERGRAQARDEQAMALWSAALPTYQEGGVPRITPLNDPLFSTEAPAFGTGEDDLRRYGEAQAFLPAEQDAFQATGDSAFGSLASRDVAVDGGSVEGQQRGQDYFEDLVTSGGRDAVAEAEYARRGAEAEQRRRAAGEAAIQRLETMGRGGSGAELLAQLGAANGAASDRYQAGMDANAVAQSRRDAAAGTASDIARARGDQQLSADTTNAANDLTAQQAKAGGTDAWSQWQQSTNAGVSAANTDRRQGAADKRWDRNNQTADKNVDLQNTRAWWQGPGQGQQQFERQQQVLAGATGQLGNNAQGLRQDGTAQPSAFGAIGKLISGIAGGMGG